MVGCTSVGALVKGSLPILAGSEHQDESAVERRDLLVGRRWRRIGAVKFDAKETLG